MHIKTVSFAIFAVITCIMANAQATFEQTPQLPVVGASDAAATASGSINVTSAEAQLVLNICRVKSMIRFAEAPDLYIDDKKVAEISNGTKVTQRLSPTASFTVKTTANPFLYRFKEELVIKGQPVEPMFIVIKAERNLAQGLSVFFGGAIAEAARQSVQVGDSKNWTTSIVPSDEFAAKCAE
jgi:hypothetical protein